MKIFEIGDPVIISASSFNGFKGTIASTYDIGYNVLLIEGDNGFSDFWEDNDISETCTFVPLSGVKEWKE